MPTFDVSRPFHERARAVIDFHDLMRFRVMDILLVASPYDTFLLEEGGQLAERQAGEFRSLDVHYEPGLTGVTRGSQALELLRQSIEARAADRQTRAAREPESRRYDLVVSTVRAGDMDVTELARGVHALLPDMPVILLAFDAQEMKDFVARRGVSEIERVFLWQGDARILQAMVKYVEDRRNVAHDTRVAGVQVILLVEDNVRRYSSFLPVLYAELLRQSRRLISEGLNVPQTIARMRARPKVLLCTTFEEAWEAFEAYTGEILGVISDIDFPRGGTNDPEAGFELARRVREAYPDVPIILHSSHEENAERARRAGADFLRKGSPLLLQRLREVLATYFGFGDFVFRLPDGREAARAGDLRSLELRLGEVPGESIAYHAERNHFSKWLKARTEFGVADVLRPRHVSDYAGVEDLRRDLIESIAAYRAERSALSVADFDRGTFDPEAGFHRIGGGSLGGKARGLAFARRLLAEARLSRRFPGALVDVPPCVVLATDVFERFLDENDLRDFAVNCDDDDEIERRFLDGRFPEDVARDLEAYVNAVRHPLAVRSSSLLEDSHYQPFTGVYATYMLPNLHPSLEVRLQHLLQAVQRVYASTFKGHTKAYLQATPYRLEEEKMAVILQRLVGSERGGRFYPDFAGVARSHNFYPTPPLQAEDGIVAVALGLGRTVVEGGNCLRFCPRHPQHLMSFSSVDDVLRNSQRDFWALALRETAGAAGLTLMSETRFDLAVAEADGTLALLGSTYSHDNHAVYDGLSRSGPRVVSFAPILKHGAFPLAEIVRTLLELAEEGVSAPVEIEFAVDLARGEFGFLQMRPLAAAQDEAAVDLGDVPPERLVCRSTRVLGHGRVEGVHDVVVIDAGRFERGRSLEVAQELAQLNARLVQDGVSYLLIGVGRWGSRDPWLGIPVSWDQISGARAIVEAGFRDLRVTPSQGSHFFQNLTSFNVAYFTVNPDLGDGFVDWDWLRAQPAVHEAGALRHLHFEQPVVVRMNGPRQEGVILKPAS